MREHDESGVEETRIVRLDEARRALLLAQSIPDVKKVRDVAAALVHYAKQQRLGLETQNAAAELKLRAERKAGELLGAMEKSKGGGGATKRSHDEIASYKSMGIRHTQAFQWQLEARIPEEVFEHHIMQANTKATELTSASLVKLGRSYARNDAIMERQDAIRMSHEPAMNFYTSLDVLVASEKTFRCIYADPPWAYDNRATRASSDRHYRVLTVDALCALPIADLAMDDAHLHLWTTNGFLFECARIFAAWGFEFKSSYVWVKPIIGIGNYWRNAHEMLLLGVRGHLTAQDKSIPSWGEYERTAHSAKPPAIRGLIERLLPGPYLELFGRQPYEGWIVYGNEHV